MSNKELFGMTCSLVPQIFFQIILGWWVDNIGVWSTMCLPTIGLTLRMSLLTLPEHLSAPPVFSGIPVTRSLVLCVMLCKLLFILLATVLSFLRIPLWYLQTLLSTGYKNENTDFSFTNEHNSNKYRMCMYVFTQFPSTSIRISNWQFSTGSSNTLFLYL